MPLAPQPALDRLPAGTVEAARWWERHLIEVITGVPPDSPPGTRPRPDYDPARRSLRQRELAKHAELTRAGHRVGLSTLKRLRVRYEREGLWGVIDHRAARRTAPAGYVDPRVVAATRQAIEEETDRSTGTVGRLRRRVEQILAGTSPGRRAAGDAARADLLPAGGTPGLGRHTFGSARTRRSLAKQPDGPFGAVTAARPGEWTQIDSTPLDVRVVHDDGTVDRVELTGLVDQATRTIAAAVLRPTTKAVDAALLLARALTPEPMRPGWTDALRLTRSVLPHQGLTAIDERLACRGPAGDRPGDDRVRPRQGLPVRRRSGPPAGRWASASARAPAHPDRQTSGCILHPFGLIRMFICLLVLVLVLVLVGRFVAGGRSSGGRAGCRGRAGRRAPRLCRYTAAR